MLYLYKCVSVDLRVPTKGNLFNVNYFFISTIFIFLPTLVVGFFVGINMDKQMEKLCNYLKAFGFNNYTLHGADTRLVYNFNTDDTAFSVAYIVQTPYTLYLDTSSMCTTRKCEHEFLKVLGSIYKFKVEADTELYELGDCDEEVTPLC